MPRLTNQSPHAAPARRERTRARAGAALVLRWTLSREAAAAAGLVEAGDGRSPVLEVRLAWEGPVDGLTAVLVDGERHEDLALEGVRGGAWVQDSAGLRHLDLPGFLRVSARQTVSGVEVLYARTELLGRLGLPGGRYDFESAAVLPQAR